MGGTPTTGGAAKTGEAELALGRKLLGEDLTREVFGGRAALCRFGGEPGSDIVRQVHPQFGHRSRVRRTWSDHAEPSTALRTVGGLGGVVAGGVGGGVTARSFAMETWV